MSLSHDHPQKCIIQQFKDRSQIEEKGVAFDEFGMSIKFNKEGTCKYLSLQVDPVVVSDELVAARMTEKEKSWQPDSEQFITAAYEFRFRETQSPPGLTETLFLWNAPFSGGTARPATSFGVVRSPLLKGYFAIASLDSEVINGKVQGFFHMAPMPRWINPTDWHKVDLSLEMNAVTIKVTQFERTETSLYTQLPYALSEKLKLEFSVDNEIIFGEKVCPVIGDRLDIASLSIFSRHNTGVF